MRWTPPANRKRLHRTSVLHFFATQAPCTVATGSLHLFALLGPRGNCRPSVIAATSAGAQDDSAVSIRAVHLKHILDRIQTNRDNVAHGRRRSGGLNAPPRHIDAVAGGVHPITTQKPLARCD